MINNDTHNFEFLPIIEPCYPNYNKDCEINNIDF